MRQTTVREEVRSEPRTYPEETTVTEAAGPVRTGVADAVRTEPAGPVRTTGGASVPASRDEVM